MNIYQSSIKLIQRVLLFFNIYISKRVQRNEQQLITEIHNRILVNSKGILHIGAHSGQEAESYDKLDKKVIWIEAVPEIYSELLKNISTYPNQKAICALLGDANKKNVLFYYASNDGASSSIFEFGTGDKIWNISTSKILRMNMVRLDNVVNLTHLNPIDHWIIDVQGAEYIVLRGAGKLLESCNSIFIEVSTDPYYLNGAIWSEIKKFLIENSFYPLWEPLNHSHADVLFIRNFN